MPSVASFVQLRRARRPTSQPPTAPTNLTAQGGIGTATLTWTASTDNTGVALYNVHRSTTSGFAADGGESRSAQATATTFTDTGVAAGTYFYVVTAQDVAGNVSAPSNEARVTVLGDTTPPSGRDHGAGGSGARSPASIDGRARTRRTTSASSACSSSSTAARSARNERRAPYSLTWNTRDDVEWFAHALARSRAMPPATPSTSTVNVTVSNTSPDPGGLVAAYGFNEGSGVQATDASGQGNTGTISSATWTAAGKFGARAVVQRHERVGDRGGRARRCDLTTGMTLEAWVNPTSGTGWRTVLLKETPGGLAYALYSANNGIAPGGFVHTSGGLGLNGTAAVPLNTWTHLAVTYDGTTLRMFVNGVQVSSGTVDRRGDHGTGALRIGGNSVWGEYFKGLIDEVRIYNRALTASEIQGTCNTPIQ